MELSDQEEFVKNFKANIDKLLSDDEEQTFNEVLNILGITMQEYFDYVFSTVVDESNPNSIKPINLNEQSRTKLVNLILEKHIYATPEEHEVLMNFNIVSFKLMYSFIDFEKDNGRYANALELAYKFIELIDKFEVKSLPEKVPDWLTTIKIKIEKQISDLYYKIELQQLYNNSTIKSSADIENSPCISSIEHLSKLYNLLLEHEPPFIEANPSFADSFCNSEINNEEQKTKWLGSQSELFYLLYLLNDNNSHYKDYYIPDVVCRLFTFPKLKSNRHSIRTSYNNFYKRITHKTNSQAYISAKQQNITALFNSLFNQ